MQRWSADEKLAVVLAGLRQTPSVAHTQLYHSPVEYHYLAIPRRCCIFAVMN